MTEQRMTGECLTEQYRAQAIPLIATLTPNPSFDLTYQLTSLAHGKINRASTAILEAGGKGINVSKALAAAKINNHCLFPANQISKLRMQDLLPKSAYLQTNIIASSQNVRTNTTVISSDGATTKLNDPGREPTPEDLDSLLAASAKAAKGCTWFVCAGSLPKGVASDFYGQVQEAAASQGASFVADTSGAALKAAISAKAHILKPNRHELADFVGQTLPTLGDVSDAAAEIVDAGVQQVVVSLGPDGALLSSKQTQAHAWAPAADVKNSVGAGDALLAGFLIGGGRGVEALVEGVAWGRAAVRSPGTGTAPPTESDRSAVKILKLERSMVMEDS